MKYSNAVKMIQNRAKKTGAQYSICDDSPSYVKVYFEGGRGTLVIDVNTWGDEPEVDSFWLREGKGRATTLTRFKNLTQALNWFAPLPPKYRVGSLVRFKDNKRNKWYKRVGDLGIVLESSVCLTPEYRLDIGDGRQDRFEQRDLELVS